MRGPVQSADCEVDPAGAVLIRFIEEQEIEYDFFLATTSHLANRVIAMFWELYRQSTINEAQATAGRASIQAQEVKLNVRQLEDKVDSLALTCQALWELLSERSSVDDDQLMEKMREIDLRDGTADGKMGRDSTRCKKCNRMLNRRRARCMYCGEFVESPHVFQQ